MSCDSPSRCHGDSDGEQFQGQGIANGVAGPYTGDSFTGDRKPPLGLHRLDNLGIAKLDGESDGVLLASSSSNFA